MADNVEMQGIEFQIINDSDEAADGIEKLSRNLETLENKVGGATTGLSRIASGLSRIKKALSDLNTGTFQAKIKGISDSLESLKTVTDGMKISPAIGNQIARLKDTINQLPEIPGGKLQSLADGLRPLSELGKQKIGPFITQLQKIPEVTESLAKVDMEKFTKQMTKLADTMRPFADEMQKVSNGFSAFPSKIQKLITSTEKYSASTQKATKRTNALENALKKINLSAIVGKVTQLLGRAVRKASDYQEVLNLFSVAMGDYAEEAYEYAQTVSEAMGIDPAEWMENQGVFNTIITGFGVAGDKAAYMSKNLTQLGYDLASFYNISFTDAMQKVQSGIAGELEPLRRLGYDLSVARLEQERLNLGIDKSVSSMTQAEKSQLRYYAMLTQVTKVQGDMARTIDQPANMLRVLKAELEQASRAIGNLFIPILTKALPWLIAIAKAVREIVAEIARLFNVEIGEVDWSSGFSTAAGASGEIDDNMENAAGAAKDLKRYLAGFDELNVLPEKNDSGSGSVSVGGGGGLDIPLPGYDFLGEEVNKRIAEIREKLEPLVKFIKDNLESILGIAETLGIVFLGWKLAKSFTDGINELKGLGAIGRITIGATLTVAGINIEQGGIQSALEKGLSGIDIAKILGGSSLQIGGGALIGGAIGKMIATAFEGTSVASAITAGGGTISTGLIGAGVGGIIAGAPLFGSGLIQAITEGINITNSWMMAAGGGLLGAGIGALFGPVGAAVGLLVGSLVGEITSLVTLAIQKWDEIEAFFAPVGEWFNDNVITPVSNFFSGLWSDISEWASEAWADIKKLFAPAAKWFDGLFSSVSQTVDDAFYDIGVIASGCWKIIKTAWGKASGWFNNNVITPVSNFFTEAWDKISDGATKAWDGIKKVFGKVGDFFSETFSKAWEGIKKVFEPFGEVFDGITDGIVEAFTGVVNGLIDGINWVVAKPFQGINWALGKLRNTKILGIQPFSNLVDISIPEIPHLASGGFVNEGQLFIAREAGAEMVGSIGRQTAVANNDQIVEAIKAGVYEAVVAATGGGNNQNGGQAQVVSANVNGKNLFEFVVDYARGETVRTGANPLLEF